MHRAPGVSAESMMGVRGGAQVEVTFDVPVPMRDGTLLRANLYRPARADRCPVLLMRTPYGKNRFSGGVTGLDPVDVARQGYLVVVQDTRGRFASDGEFRPWHEAEDGYDTIAWAAELPFADGQVGTFGASYAGFSQWAAAALQPQGLAAISAFTSCADPLQGLFFRGGAFHLGMNAMWYLSVLGPEILARRYRADRSGRDRALAALANEVDAFADDGFIPLPLADFAPLRRHPVGPAFFEPIVHPMNPAAFHHMTIGDKYDRVLVPSFNVGGWYDNFQQQTIDNYLAMRSRGVHARLLVGPWAHDLVTNPIGEVNFGMAAEATTIDLQSDVGGIQLRWFDRWLKGLQNGADEEPPVKYFVMGANTWCEDTGWPPSRRLDTAYYLHPGGGLSPAPPADSEADVYLYDPADPVPTWGGATFLLPEFPNGPRDQRMIEARPDALTYTTQRLDEDVEVSGRITVYLWATSSAPDTDFVARLCNVFPSGLSLDLTDGIIRARYRDYPRGTPSLIEPGRPYEYVIDLWSTSNLFRAGHRIRLDITSSSFPRWHRNPNTGHDLFADATLRVARQAVLHDPVHPSRVILPVVRR
jgi:uncharacterized protein